MPNSTDKGVLRMPQHIPLGRPRERARTEARGIAASSNLSSHTGPSHSITSSGLGTSLGTTASQETADQSLSAQTTSGQSQADRQVVRISSLSTQAVQDSDSGSCEYFDDDDDDEEEEEGEEGESRNNPPYQAGKGKQVMFGPIATTSNSRPTPQAQVEPSASQPASVDVNLMDFNFGFDQDVQPGITRTATYPDHEWLPTEEMTREMELTQCDSTRCDCGRKADQPCKKFLRRWKTN